MQCRSRLLLESSIETTARQMDRTTSCQCNTNSRRAAAYSLKKVLPQLKWGYKIGRETTFTALIMQTKTTLLIQKQPLLRLRHRLPFSSSYSPRTTKPAQLNPPPHPPVSQQYHSSPAAPTPACRPIEWKPSVDTLALRNTSSAQVY